MLIVEPEYIQVFYKPLEYWIAHAFIQSLKIF